ncbi:MerR family transcriptional regulator [Nocardioides taihuensis]|uniref:MerR family transcriptional regulator n=1 Tax=Nocardioides taihuensis TaxID=1835606 RepID=A0ABW0BE83_9ACTN
MRQIPSSGPTSVRRRPERQDSLSSNSSNGATNGRGSSDRASHGPADEVEPAGQGLYIKQVAEILGVSASVLRAWESERLIVPGRSASGYRVYSAADVDRLRRIRDLIQQDGLNPAGVRRLLRESDWDTQQAVTPSDFPSAAIHARIQRLRKEQRKTLRDLAAATGVSASAISAIERGVSMPSNRTLLALADALDTTVPNILGTASEGPPVVVRASERTPLDLSIPGVTAASLAPVPGAVEPMVVVVEPGAGPDRQSDTGDGEMFIFVLAGEVQLVLDELEHFRICHGDSALFHNARAHRWINRTMEPAQLLVIRFGPTSG